jgi:hypothetical protein
LSFCFGWSINDLVGTSVAPEPRVKGVAFRSIDACFLELRGEAASNKARELMHADVRNAYRSGLLLSASWYPISWYREVFRAFRAATGDGVELARQIGYCSSRRDMQGVHKQLLAWLVSPQRLLSFSQKFFSGYYDTGTFEVLESGRGFVRVRLSGCVGWDQNMWVEIAGSSLALLEIAGAKNVRLRMLSGGRDGDTGCEMEAHWV